jgi:hypothetical protein
MDEYVMMQARKEPARVVCWEEDALGVSHGSLVMRWIDDQDLYLENVISGHVHWEFDMFSGNLQKCIFHRQMSRSAPVCGGKCPSLITRIPVRHVPMVIASITALVRVNAEGSLGGARCCALPATNGRVSRMGAASGEIVTGLSPPVTGTANDESQFRSMGDFDTRFRRGVSPPPRCP